MLKKPFRRFLRLILFFLARAALKKHHPTVVAIVGEGKTGIVREAVYAAIKEKLPARRNLEAPDAEFVLPLTVLGASEYPFSALGWIRLILRSAGQLIFLPPHPNVLILEMGYARKEIFDYFWNITQPKILITCGAAPFLSADQTAPKSVRVEETADLSGYMRAAIKVAGYLGVSRPESQKNLRNFDLPRARINILPALGGGMVVDATYHYFPTSSEALDEILEALPGKKIFLYPGQSASGKLDIRKGEIAVLLGPRRRMTDLLTRLTQSSWT